MILVASLVSLCLLLPLLPAGVAVEGVSVTLFYRTAEM